MSALFTFYNMPTIYNADVDDDDKDDGDDDVSLAGLYDEGRCSLQLELPNIYFCVNK